MKKKSNILFNSSWSDLKKQIATLNPSQIFILTDENTSKFCLRTVKKNCNFSFKEIQIKSGEANKNLTTCEIIWQKLLKNEADRNSILINLGGGVITDMGGFAAATFKRGIKFIQLPTTLMAMADAALGGKTGINFLSSKNQIGTFSKAELIFIQTEFLKTLPERQSKNGFAEIIKHSILVGGDFWKKIKSIPLPDLEFIENILPTSIDFKMKIVEEDEKENGNRKILNFGHTIGHAIESASLKYDKKPLLHGEAVLKGMWIETLLSIIHAGLAVEEANEIFDCLENFISPPKFTKEEIKSILSFIIHDKKNSYHQLKFVLLKKIGKPVIDKTISTAEINELLHHC